MESLRLFEEARDQLATKLESQLQDVDGDPSKKFAPRNAAEDVFKHEYETIYILHTSAKACQGYTVEGVESYFFANRLRADHARPSQRTFAILLCMRMSPCDLENFEALDETGVDDNHLPLTESESMRLFKESGPEFYNTQFAWCPIILQEDTKVDYIGNKKSCPLPRLSKKVIGHGSYGEVSEVQIEQGHIEFKSGPSRKGYFAQKDFIVARNPNSSFTEEWGVIQDILRASRTHRHILHPIAALRYGDGLNETFSMFFPLADCNLQDYLRGRVPHRSADIYPPGGFEKPQKRKIFWQAISLVDALDHLHHGLHVESDHRYTCWHLDLKLSNILVTFVPSDNEELSVKFQITDFGISRMKQPHSRGGTRTRDHQDSSNQLFQPRTYASPTVARGGDASDCLAPEAYGGGSNITGASDIWSLGCILSIIFTFMEGGPHAVENFAARRERLPSYGSWFFTKTEQLSAPSDPLLYYDGNQQAQFHRNESVDNWFTHLNNDCQPIDKPKLQQSLRIILQGMLVPNPSRRGQAKDIHLQFRSLYSESQSDIAHNDQMHKKSTPGPSLPLPNTNVLRTTTPIKTPQNHLWTRERAMEDMISAAKAGKCEIVRQLIPFLDVSSDIRDGSGKSPIYFAAEKGDSAMLQLLLEKTRIDPGKADKSGKYPLLKAAENGHDDVVTILLRSKRVNVNCKSDQYHGWTPLACAAMNNHTKVVRTLLKLGRADAECPDVYQRSPLSWACEKGFTDVVKLLLSCGKVAPLREDCQGRTPRDRALTAGKNDLVELLDSARKPHRRLLRLSKRLPGLCKKSPATSEGRTFISADENGSKLYYT